MRPDPGRGNNDSHLWPCPRCGSTNGLNAGRCWSCETTLPASRFDPFLGAMETDDLAAAEAQPVAGGASRALPDRVELHAARHEVETDPQARERSHPAPSMVFDGRFAALASASARAARRRRGVVFAGAALLALVLVLAGYPVYHDDLRVDLSPAQLDRAAAMPTAAPGAGTAPPAPAPRLAPASARTPAVRGPAPDRAHARHARVRELASKAQAPRAARTRAATARKEAPRAARDRERHIARFTTKEPSVDAAATVPVRTNLPATGEAPERDGPSAGAPPGPQDGSGRDTVPAPTTGR